MARTCKGCGKNLRQKYMHFCTSCAKKNKRQKKDDHALQKRLREALKTKDKILDFLFKKH